MTEYEAVATELGRTSSRRIKKSRAGEDKKYPQIPKFRVVESFDPDDGRGECRVSRHNQDIVAR